MSRTWRGPRREFLRKKKRQGGWAVKGRAAQEFGRALENRICLILEEAVRSGRIDSFKYHAPHSPEDKRGKDFTVTRDGVSHSFGVTTSNRAWKRSYAKYGPKLRIFHFSSDVTDEAILRQILSLFEPIGTMGHELVMDV